MGGTYRKFGQGLSLRWLVLLVVFALLVGFVLGKKTQKGPALSPLPVYSSQDSLKILLKIPLDQPRVFVSRDKHGFTIYDSVQIDSNMHRPAVPILRNNSDSLNKTYDSVKVVRCTDWFSKRPDVWKSVMNCRCKRPYSLSLKDSCRFLGLPQ